MSDVTDQNWEQLFRSLVGRALCDYLAIHFPQECRPYIERWRYTLRPDHETNQDYDHFVLEQRTLLGEYFGEDGPGTSLAEQLDMEGWLGKIKKAISEGRSDIAVKLQDFTIIAAANRTGIAAARGTRSFSSPLDDPMQFA